MDRHSHVELALRFVRASVDPHEQDLATWLPAGPGTVLAVIMMKIPAQALDVALSIPALAPRFRALGYTV